MANAAEIDRISNLLEKASLDTKAGNIEDAALSLKEANSLDPHNEQVRAALDGLRGTASTSEGILEICEVYVHDGDDDTGRKCIQIVKSDKFSESEAAQTLSLLLSSRARRSLTDQIVGALLDTGSGQKCMARTLRNAPTETFRRATAIGDETINGIIKTLLSPTPWESERERNECENMIVILSLAEILRAGDEDPKRAMRTLARLMASDGPQLHEGIDEENLEIILDCLDVQRSLELRSQATLAAAKYVESAGEKGQSLLKDYVITRIQRREIEGLTSAFSAAAALFPVIPTVASNLFLGAGFTEHLQKIVLYTESKRLQHAVLELLSAACVDKGCREAITKEFTPWLKTVIDMSEDQRNVATAALVLSKTSGRDKDLQANSPTVQPSELVARLKEMMMSTDEDTMRSSIEGLAYNSVEPEIKEFLVNDSSFLEALLKILKNSSSTGPIRFGGLTVLSNLTIYPPLISAEQKRMAQLKAYANQSKPAEPSPLEDNKHVDARCAKVLDAKIVPILVQCAKQASPTLLELIATIALSLAKVPKHCGVMVQQGILDILLNLGNLDVRNNPRLTQVRTKSAQALARILLPIDPSLIFNTPTNRPIEATVQALSTLLKKTDVSDVFTTPEADNDPTIAFDGLRALTNLATLSENACSLILSASWPDIEGYLWSNASALSQTATECVANLCVSQAAAAKFTGIENQNRLITLFALSNASARGTRLAATAALAHITTSDAGTRSVLDWERGVSTLEELSASSDADLKLRADAALQNMSSQDGALGEEARRRLKAPVAQ